MSVQELERRDALRSPVEQLARMIEIRVAEDTIRELFATGLIAGSTHTCQGQEAVSVGIASVLRPTDMVSCTYRGHGHALALGMTPLGVIAEILGREDGCVGGIGGSMHLCDRRIGLMPTMAIVGAGIPIAAGAAWAAQLEGRDDVAVAIFGDGSANIGAFHEGINIAAVWKLPVVFICENNLYGEYSRIDETTAVDDIADRAGSYGIPGEVVDGQDLAAVIDAVGRAVARARAGDGPTLLEMKTYRYAGHSRSDQATYRPAGELDAWLARDPIEIHARALIAAGTIVESDFEGLRERATAEVDAAVEAAKLSPEPDRSRLLENVYALAGTGRTPDDHHRSAAETHRDHGCAGAGALARRARRPRRGGPADRIHRDRQGFHGLRVTGGGNRRGAPRRAGHRARDRGRCLHGRHVTGPIR